jgi:hypothetical protein
MTSWHLNRLQMWRGGPWAADPARPPGGPGCRTKCGERWTGFDAFRGAAPTATDPSCHTRFAQRRYAGRRGPVAYGGSKWSGCGRPSALQLPPSLGRRLSLTGAHVGGGTGSGAAARCPPAFDRTGVRFASRRPSYVKAAGWRASLRAVGIGAIQAMDRGRSGEVSAPSSRPVMRHGPRVFAVCPCSGEW